MIEKGQDAHLASPVISFNLGVPTQLAQTYGAEQGASKRGKTSYEGKRETPVQKGENEEAFPGSTRNQSNSSNMQVKSDPPNPVSSGEVSLVNGTVKKQ